MLVQQNQELLEVTQGRKRNGETRGIFGEFSSALVELSHDLPQPVGSRVVHLELHGRQQNVSHAGRALPELADGVKVPVVAVCLLREVAG